MSLTTSLHWLAPAKLRNESDGGVHGDLRQHAGDGCGGLAFAGGVATGDGDVQFGAGGLGGEGDDALTVGHQLVEDLHAGGLHLGAEAVVVGTAGVVPISEQGAAAGRTGGEHEVLGCLGAGRIGRLVEAEGIPAFIVVAHELAEFLAEIGEAGAGGLHTVEVVLVCGADVGVRHGR